jgi:hypothetical protein
MAFTNAQMTTSPAHSGTACPRCKSRDVRRSMPRGPWERLVRRLTPYHYFLCRECSYRGFHFGAVTAGSGDGPALPSRPVEVRDQEARRRRIRQVATSILLATVMGVGAGVMIHSCRQRAESAQTLE